MCLRNPGLPPTDKRILQLAWCTIKTLHCPTQDSLCIQPSQRVRQVQICLCAEMLQHPLILCCNICSNHRLPCPNDCGRGVDDSFQLCVNYVRLPSQANLCQWLLLHRERTYRKNILPNVVAWSLLLDAIALHVTEASFLALPLIVLAEGSVTTAAFVLFAHRLLQRIFA